MAHPFPERPGLEALLRCLDGGARGSDSSSIMTWVQANGTAVPSSAIGAGDAARVVAHEQRRQAVHRRTRQAARVAYRLQAGCGEAVQ